MSDAAKLIEELARYVERPQELDGGKLVEIYARIQRLRESGEEFGQKGQIGRAAREAELLMEKIVLGCVNNASAALGVAAGA
jgi:hypothetical protein